VPLEIVQAGSAVLRAVARALTREEILSAEIAALIESMRETMHAAPGVGLAAPQIGAPLRLAVIEDKPEYIERLTPVQAMERDRRPVPFHVIINPVLSMADAPPTEFFEGCLSVAGFTAIVPRANRVHVDYLDHRGDPVSIDAEGWYARILQHEIDHLNGILYIDRMKTRSFCTVANYERYWKNLSAAEFEEQIS
jgi:peptide deformylase